MVKVSLDRNHSIIKYCVLDYSILFPKKKERSSLLCLTQQSWHLAGIASRFSEASARDNPIEINTIGFWWQWWACLPKGFILKFIKKNPCDTIGFTFFWWKLKQKVELVGRREIFFQTLCDVSGTIAMEIKLFPAQFWLMNF